jgi:hypothetical protein
LPPVEGPPQVDAAEIAACTLARLGTSMTYGARHRCEEKDDQLIEDPAGMAKFSIALFGL